MIINNYLLYWRKLLQDLGRKKIRKRILIFFLCLFLAGAFWVLNILGKSYRFELETNINFDNLPEDKALSLEQAPIVTFTVEGTGWNFIRSKMQFLKDTLTVDLRKFNSRDELDLNKALIDFEQQWESKLKIMNVYPSKIIFNLEQKKIKKVPIKLQANISYKENYNISKEIKIYPDSVYIKGPVEIIRKINYIETRPLVLANLDHAMIQHLKIHIEKYPNVVFSNSDIKVELPVEQFTENVIDLPINLKSDNASSNMLLFPLVCKVKFKVAMSQYSKIMSQSFRVFAEKNDKMSNRLSLRLVSQPAHVKDVEIIPETVEYIIIQK